MVLRLCDMGVNFRITMVIAELLLVLQELQILKLDVVTSLVNFTQFKQG